VTIEVVSYSRSDRMPRDRADAETPAAAVIAARSLLTDAYEAGLGSPRASFYVDGKLVRYDVTLNELSMEALQ
jgi:hypothetical protein